MHKILLIDDDKELCESLCTFFRNEGYQLTYFTEANEGILCASTTPFDIIILDINLPDHSGIKILKTLKSYLDIPIIMFTGSENDMEHIVSLEIGADDFIEKPCRAKVLLARIKSILKREQAKNNLAIKNDFCIENICVFFSTLSIEIDNLSPNFTKSEFAIFTYLLDNKSKACSKNDISKIIFNKEFSKHDRSIDAHVNNIRKKIKNLKKSSPKINTVHGYGYQLVL